MINLVRWLVVVAMTFAGIAVAQPTADRIEYRSAFEGFRSFKEPELGSWANANEEAGALGGHVGQLKGSRPASDAAAHSTHGASGGDSRSSNRPGTPAPASPKPAAAHQGHSK